MAILEYKETLEASLEEMKDILSPIFTSGKSITEFKLCIAYWYSLSLKKKGKKSDSSFEYVEALMCLFQKMEKNKEIMEEVRKYMKKNI